MVRWLAPAMSAAIGSILRMAQTPAIPKNKVRTTDGGWTSIKKARDYVSRGRARWQDGLLHFIEGDYRNLSAERSMLDAAPSTSVKHTPSLVVSAFCGSDANLGQTFVRYPQNRIFA